MNKQHQASPNTKIRLTFYTYILNVSYYRNGVRLSWQAVVSRLGCQDHETDQQESKHTALYVHDEEDQAGPAAQQWYNKSVLWRT